MKTPRIICRVVTINGRKCDLAQAFCRSGVAAVTLLLCGCAPTPALQTQPRAASAAQRAALYTAYCVSCHGADGKNDRQGANPAMRLSAANALPENAWNALVENGRKEMPAFHSRLSRDQINALRNYVQTLTQDNHSE